MIIFKQISNLSERISLRLLRSCFSELRGKQDKNLDLSSYSTTPTQLPTESLKICLYISSLAAGGAERQIVTLGRSLAKLGHHVHLICATGQDKHNPYQEMLDEAHISVTVIDRTNLIKNLHFCRANNIDLRALKVLPGGIRPLTLAVTVFLLQHKFHALHCYLDMPNCTGGVAGIIAQLPAIVMSARNKSLDTNEDINKCICEEYYRSYKKILSLPHVALETNSFCSAIDYARWLKIPQKKIHVAPNGIAADFIQKTSSANSATEVRKELGIMEKDPVVIVIQRLVREKRPLLPFNILANVRRKVSKVKLIYVGEGPFLTQAGMYVDHLKLRDSVFLLGKRSDIPRLLRASNIMLLTSRSESLPNVIIEAMLAGLPIVATNVGGVPELVHEGIHGLLADNPPQEDQASLEALAQNMAEKIVCLLSNHNLAKAMGDAGNKRISTEFSDDKLAYTAIQSYRRSASQSAT